MRRMLLLGGGAAAAIVVLVIVAVTLLVSNLDGLVKKVIETVGTEVAGATVTVDEVTVSLGEGTASITGLAVANPAGFTSPKAISLGRISVALDTGSVTGNPVVIKTISVVEPAITYELGETGSNIDVLQKHVQAKTGGGAASAPKAQGGGDDRKLVIDRLAVTGGSVTLATPLPGVKGAASLGDIVITGIGREGGGASPAEVAGRFLDALIGSALKSARSLGVGDVGETVKGLVPGDAKGALQGIFGK